MKLPLIIRTTRNKVLLMAALFCSVPASAATLTSSLSDPVYSGISWTATSTVDAIAGFLCTPCTVTHSIQGEAIDGDVSFVWDMADAGYSFSGVIPTASGLTPTSTYTTYETVASATGSLTITNTGLDPDVGIAGPAGYFREAPGAAIEALSEALDLIGDAAETKSDISGSPTKISFVSRVVRTEAGYAYTNSVQNFTDTAINFAWTAAGLSGIVNPLSTVFSDTVIGARPTEIKGVAAAGIGQREVDLGVFEDNLYTVRANVLAPVPLPAAMWMFISAVGGLVVAGRKRMPG